VLLVVGWPRLRRHGATLAARATGLVALNLAVLAFSGAVLNDQFGFFVSWSDLLGARSPETVTHHGATSRQALGVHVDGQLPATATGLVATLKASNLRVQQYVVHGPASHLTDEVDVLLPAGYDPSSSRSYPVIEALHGYPGTAASWLEGMGLQQAVDGLVRRRLLAAPLVVLPQVNAPYGVDTECVDGPAGAPQMETWLTRDVPDFVASHFHVRRDRASWAVAGYSEGGWCAAMVGLRHPGVFGGDLVFSGSFRPEFGRSYRPFGSRVPAGYNLVSLARHRPPPVAMWIQSSKRDGYSYPQTVAFLRAVRPPLSVTADLLKTGGHRVTLWASELPNALRWLAGSLPGFRP
jgi:S-formylglutathione hydrolase FrmB